MGCRGVFFALSTHDDRGVLAAESDAALVELIQEEIEERWETEWLAEADSAWDAMHRCLGDGTLGLGTSPLAKCVLGGRQLHSTPAYIAAYLSAAEVRDLVPALKAVDRDWFRNRYQKLASTDYEGPLNEQDFEYTWESFVDARSLFLRAGTARRAMLFTASQ